MVYKVVYLRFAIQLLRDRLLLPSVNLSITTILNIFCKGHGVHREVFEEVLADRVEGDQVARVTPLFDLGFFKVLQMKAIVSKAGLRTLIHVLLTETIFNLGMRRNMSALKLWRHQLCLSANSPGPGPAGTPL